MTQLRKMWISDEASGDTANVDATNRLSVSVDNTAAVTNEGNTTITGDEVVSGTPTEVETVDGDIGVGMLVSLDHVDTTTNAVKTLDYPHAEVHEGSHFNYCSYQLNNASAATIEFVVTTPDTTKWGHLTFEFGADQGATVDIYEGTSGVTGGTTITPRNNNRNSATASVMTIVQDPAAITSDGTLAAGFLAGGTRTSGFAVREKENILKQNETYLFRITSLANSNDISFCFEWYEHTNR